MKIAKVFGIALTVLLVVAAASPASAADKADVGYFLTEIAKAKNISVTSPSEAERALRNAGYKLPDLDLRAELTEGMVANISNSLGIQVNTSNPGAAFTVPQVAGWVSAFGSDLGPGGGTDNPAPAKANPLLKGKGKKKGLLKRSPTDPV